MGSPSCDRAAVIATLLMGRPSLAACGGHRAAVVAALLKGAVAAIVVAVQTGRAKTGPVMPMEHVSYCMCLLLSCKGACTYELPAQAAHRGSSDTDSSYLCSVAVTWSHNELCFLAITGWLHASVQHARQSPAIAAACSISMF